MSKISPNKCQWQQTDKLWLLLSTHYIAFQMFHQSYRGSYSSSSVEQSGADCWAARWQCGGKVRDILQSASDNVYSLLLRRRLNEPTGYCFWEGSNWTLLAGFCGAAVLDYWFHPRFLGVLWNAWRSANICDSTNSYFYSCTEERRLVSAVSALIWRSMVRAWSLPSCWFLRQESLPYIVSLHPGVSTDISDHNAGG